MRLRICVLTRETALHWAAFYVTAFRQTCDVVSIGPAWNRKDAEDFADPDYVARSVVKNDIISDATDAAELLESLPGGWNPDLLVTIQSGAPPIGGIARVGCPTVYLSIDTWHDPREFIIARQYNFVFLAQKALVKYMRMAGCRFVYWLPLACDPAAHFILPEEETHDFAFVGRYHFLANRQRVARINELSKHFRVAVYNGLDANDMARAYGSARVVFNASIAKDVNMRVFEALATGRPLLTNHEAEANGLFDLFEDGRHLITYTDENLLTQAQRCLEDPEWARAIGEAGKKEVLEKHTYRHRVQELQGALTALLPALGNRVYQRLKQGARVVDFIPFGAQSILDVGLAMDASRISLRRAGVVHVEGVAPDAELREQRASTYESVHLQSEMDDIRRHDFDVVIWNCPNGMGLDWQQVFSRSTAWLKEGGTILLVIEDRVLAPLLGEISTSTIESWLVAHGFTFQVRRAASAESGPHVIAARQWSHPVEDIIAQMYREFPTNGIASEEQADRVNEAVPDSPSVEHP